MGDLGSGGRKSCQVGSFLRKQIQGLSHLLSLVLGWFRVKGRMTIMRHSPDGESVARVQQAVTGGPAGPWLEVQQGHG